MEMEIANEFGGAEGGKVFLGAMGPATLLSGGGLSGDGTAM